ncbi:unnamed protein product [Allacma fusca]|uniref:Uncharacterized protein n=1 Tax=Allacma fusca TaxID=39272 RepID=A0A8J2PJL4_9HEXA|nr:unnamed protein product [Allacma fusca]
MREFSAKAQLNPPVEFVAVVATIFGFGLSKIWTNYYITTLTSPKIYSKTCHDSRKCLQFAEDIKKTHLLIPIAYTYWSIQFLTSMMASIFSTGNCSLPVPSLVSG